MEYYAPQGTPFNPSDLCRGEITEIFPSEGLSIITSTHLIIDGLYPITYGRPIRLNREGEWTNTDNCECIVDRQEDGVRRQSGMFKAVVDTAKEAFYTSNESKQLEDFASPSEEEESNDGGFDFFLAFQTRLPSSRVCRFCPTTRAEHGQRHCARAPTARCGHNRRRPG